MAAAVQSLQHHPSMTLGVNNSSSNDTPPTNKMQFKTNNCVIVTSNYNNQIQQTKSVIQQNTTAAVKRPLVAAAPERTSVVVNNNSLNISNNTNDMLRCKRKINFTHHIPPYGTPGAHQPASVARRNARERNRVKQVNNGFATLRQHIPASVAAALSSSNSSSTSNSSNNRGNNGSSKKLSKVETLRMAVEYIRSLQHMIQQHEMEISNLANTTANSSNVRSMNTEHIENEYYENSNTKNILTHNTPPCSESSASPTPSYSSESSLSTPTTAVAYTQLNVYHPESYENYEPMSPEDEELLDVISWWQQQ